MAVGYIGQGVPYDGAGSGDHEAAVRAMVNLHG